MIKRKINKKQVSVSERHFEVVLEDIDSKLGLVLEGHKALDTKIDKNHGEFREFRKEVDYKFDVVFEKFNKIDTKFDEIDARFNEIDVQFNDVKDELHVIRNELKEKVGRDEFVLLEKRVMALEKSKK
jgi:GTP-binding protein EngB required for normal cell division